jgi:hypothetical protein
MVLGMDGLVGTATIKKRVSVMTYCNNAGCPFKSCKKHLINVKKLDRNKIKYIDTANLGGVCREYLSYVFDIINEERLETSLETF